MTGFSSMRWICLSLTFLVVCGLLDAGFARERGPRVEVVCPQRLVPFTLDKRTVLVYELHVTNFDACPSVHATVSRILGVKQEGRKRITAAEFLNGVRLQAGEHFETP